MTTSTTTISSVVLEVADVAAAEAFYTALGVGDRVRVRASEAPTSGFRGFTLSLVVSQPANVDALRPRRHRRRRDRPEARQEELLGLRRRRTGAGRHDLEDRDSSKKDTGPATREYDDLVLLLGVEDVKATKQFYVDHGLAVARASAASTSSSRRRPASSWRSTPAAPPPRTPASPRRAPVRTGSPSSATAGRSPTRTGSRGRNRPRTGSAEMSAIHATRWSARQTPSPCWRLRRSMSGSPAPRPPARRTWFRCRSRGWTSGR